MKRLVWSVFKPAFALAGLLLLSGQAWSQAGELTNRPALAEEDLINNLRQGGYVLLMRHAFDHRDLPDTEEVLPDNREGERQLSEEGREDAAAVGEALRQLQIPVGDVWASPAYRAVQTAQAAGWEQFSTEPQLDNEAAGLVVGATDSEWLRQKVAEVPSEGNTIIITHPPNIARAYPLVRPLPQQGEILVFDPDNEDRTGPVLVSRVTPDQWEELVELVSE